MIPLQYSFFDLQLQLPFGVAGNIRTSTQLVFIKLITNNITAFGEASLPPYLPETQQSVLSYIKEIANNKKINLDLDLTTNLLNIQDKTLKNNSAVAALDMLLHDYYLQKEYKTIAQYYNINNTQSPYISYTISLDDINKIEQKIKLAENFNLLKVKLGNDNDKQIIETIRKHSNKPIYIDVNQGWQDVEKSIDFCYYLKEQNIILIEQPFNKLNYKAQEKLKVKNILPLIADEAFQNISDLTKCEDLYNGINIKLMKCGGLHNANNIINKAKKVNLEIMMGSMNESSCAIQAAVQLSPLCNYADLDGPFLTKNNPFTNPILEMGKFLLPKKNGLGLLEQPNNATFKLINS